MRGNWLYALMALVLAVLSWYYVSGREMVETWVEAPVEFTGMPQDLVIRGSGQGKVSVRLRGPKVLVRNLNPKDMIYPLNLSGLKPGVNVLTFRPEAIPVGRGIEVMEINPQRLTLDVDRIMEKSVPVRPGWTGEVHEDYEFSRIVAEPGYVLLRGPETLVSGIDTLGTQPLHVNATVRDMVEENIPVVLDNQVEARPSHVTVRLFLAAKTREESVKLPVRAASPRGFTSQVEPKTVKVKARVPLPLLRDIEDRHADLAERFNATVPFPNVGFVSPVFDEEIAVSITTPEGASVLSVSPEKVKLHITALETNATRPLTESKESP